jgi:hypothetical protein
MNPLKGEVSLVREKRRYEKMHPRYEYHQCLPEERFEGSEESLRLPRIF